MGATTGIFLKLMTLPFGEGGPRPKGLASLRSGSEEVPTRRASRLCHDKGAKQTEGDLFSHLLRKCQLPQRGSLLDPTTVKTGTTILYIGGSIPVPAAAILLGQRAPVTKRRMNAED